MHAFPHEEKSLLGLDPNIDCVPTCEGQRQGDLVQLVPGLDTAGCGRRSGREAQALSVLSGPPCPMV